MPQPQTAPATETRQMPVQYRAAPVGAVNTEARTADLIFSTGVGVARRDWWTGERYIEELSLDPKHVRMNRFEQGAVNIIDSHNQYELRAILGIAESATLAKGEARAVARFSRREDVEPYFQDVVDGIIRNCSVGYIVHAYEKIEKADGTLPTWRAIDWEPAEISLVSVPADAGAGARAMKDHPDEAAKVRTFPCQFVPPAAAAAAAVFSTTREEPAMPTPNNPAASPAANPAADQTTTDQRAAPAPAVAPAAPDETAIRAAATAAERTRVTEIQARTSAAGMTVEFERSLINDGLTVEQSGARIADELARRQASSPSQRPQSNVSVTRDQVDTQRRAIEEALLHRANPQAHKATDGSRQYRGMTLIDMARDRIEAAGGNTRGMSRREIAVIALNLDRDMGARAGMNSTSDFPQILASTVNRTLRAGYELYPRTFMGWARPSTAPDFRQVARTQLSELTAFQTVNEGGEYKRLQFGDAAEKYSLGKSGGIIAITWESIINDDLGAFDRLPSMIGAEAAATQADVVYGILSANAVMSDSVALFHATHGNLPTAAAITDVTLGVARAAMRKQTGPKGRVLNLTPDFLIVGPDKESEANKYTSSQFVAAKSVDINPAYNTSLEVIVEPRITGNKWYLSATPQRVDTVEYAFLEGEDGLYTEQRQGFEVDGLEIKARQAFAAKAIDWRGMQYNSGA